LSLAEILAVYPKIKILFRTDKAVIFESSEEPNIEKLGGTPKLGKVIGEGKSLKEIILTELKKESKEKKIFFGISFYGAKSDNNLGRTIKNILTDDGYKVRWVTGKEKILSSVIVKTNKLLRRGGEFCILPSSSLSTRGRKEEGVWVAKTIDVQDFFDYEFRDMKRPARDLVSGMTPPKLAKMLINLGGASDEVLDPFCGSGTLLMEAALLGIKDIYGSDISEKAVDDSKKNIVWLKEKYQLSSMAFSEIKKCDVNNLQECWQKKFKLIVGEPYLGPAIRGGLSFEKAKNLQKELEENYDRYLKGLSDSLKKNGKLVLIVPFMITAEKIFYLDIDIKKYGLESIHELILYSRPDQKIGRQIYILKKT